MESDIRIINTPLDEEFCRQFVDHPNCGGIVVFTGTVRNKTFGKRVIFLEFEALESMAIKEIEKICSFTFKRWPVKKIAVHHRVGKLAIGEVPVIIAVSAPHRLAAFESCQYIIDTLKKKVPIWKKEVFDDGEVWVAAHP
jgi:molybdopterin synthase catalytic subunit